MKTPTIKELISSEEGKEQMDELIDDALGSINFYKIHYVMEKLNWTWATTDNHVPTPTELSETLKKQLSDMFNGDYESFDGGGFYGMYNIELPTNDDEPIDFAHCVNLRVSFEIESYNNFY